MCTQFSSALLTFLSGPQGSVGKMTCLSKSMVDPADLEHQKLSYGLLVHLTPNIRQRKVVLRPATPELLIGDVGIFGIQKSFITAPFLKVLSFPS